MDRPLYLLGKTTQEGRGNRVWQNHVLANRSRNRHGQHYYSRSLVLCSGRGHLLRRLVRDLLPDGRCQVKTRTYHGWILIEPGGQGMKDYVSVEFLDGSVRIHHDIGRGESGAAKAVEWWDDKLKAHVQIEPTLKGCYRVYTEALK